MNEYWKEGIRVISDVKKIEEIWMLMKVEIKSKMMVVMMK